MEVIAESGLKLGVDPLGGGRRTLLGTHCRTLRAFPLRSSTRSWILPLRSCPLDKDGKIRMDCSSPFAMQGLIKLKDKFDIAFGNDADVDRHGIVTKSAGLLNPNHYLSVAIWYLFQNRPDWRQSAAVGKTLVSTSMIDRVTGASWENVV